MKKYFVFSDVHGHYELLIVSLEKAGFDINNNDHILISCGDNFDRGNNNYGVYNFLTSIPKDRIFLIKGNHEKMLEDVISTFQIFPEDKINGTADTYFELSEKLNDKRLTDVLTFIKSSNYFVQINDHIFVHAFIPLGVDYKTASDMEWEKALWTNTRGILSVLPKLNKTIVCGHVHAKNFHNLNDIFYKKKTNNSCGFIAIDGGAYSTGKINIFVMNEDGSYDNEVYKTTLKDVIK